MVPFIALSQILPISFTACLFTIQLHLDAMGLSPDAQPGVGSKTGKDAKEAAKPSTEKPGIKMSSLTLPTILFNVALLALPTLKSQTIFIPLVLFTRLMLLVPHTGRIRFDKKDVLQSVSISFGFLVASLTMMRGTTTFRETIGGISRGGFAVKALAHDAELSLLICTLLKWGGGV